MVLVTGSVVSTVVVVCIWIMLSVSVCGLACWV